MNAAELSTRLNDYVYGTGEQTSSGEAFLTNLLYDLLDCDGTYSDESFEAYIHAYEIVNTGGPIS